MIDPASGPFLFDTSADSYLARSSREAEREWLRAYLALYPVNVSVVTVIERMRGYALLLERSDSSRRPVIETARNDYLRAFETDVTSVLPLRTADALVAAELMVAFPGAPSPPQRAHKLVESRSERLSRWRFDIMIAATALAAGLPLIHNNPEDFESLRAWIERFPERFPGVGPLELISVKRLAA